MISLNQIQLLEQKIESAIIKIETLTAENKTLAADNDALKTETESLSAKLQDFQANQTKIEQGIINALRKLETVENTIIETVGNSAQEQQPDSRNTSKPAAAHTDAAKTPADEDKPAQETPAPAQDSAPQFDIF